MKICCSKNSLDLKMKDLEAKKLFKKGLKKIANGINKEISALCWEIEKLTKQVEIEENEKVRFSLYADILFEKLTKDHKENESELRKFVFKRYDEIRAEREEENE